MDLQSLARSALEEAGARFGPVPGAKIANSMAALAENEGFDYRSAMRSLGLTVKGLLRTLEGVNILHQERGDFQAIFADALASIAGEAERSPPRGPRYLRKDVFEAFTRITDQGYHYVLDQEHFIAPVYLTASSTIPVPSPSLEQLIKMRGDFAAIVRDENPQAAMALEATLTQENALAKFRTVLAKTTFEDRWRDYQSERLRPRILEWAAQNSVVARESWFEASSSRRDANGLGKPRSLHRSALRLVIDRLSDDELRSVLLPLRVVERLMEERYCLSPWWQGFLALPWLRGFPHIATLLPQVGRLPLCMRNTRNQI